jgi:hypothetical protein
MAVMYEHGKITAPIGHAQTVEVRLHRLERVANPRQLPPRDVMFKNGKAFHNACGEGATEHEDAHDVDPDTVVALRRGQDQIRWVGDEPFAVVGIRRQGPGHAAADIATPEAKAGPAAYDNPFEFVLPRRSDDSHRVTSGVPRMAAEPGRYKVTFSIGNELVDPDVEIF